ncbi:MAG: CPBP family intramembrane metalloprotease [Caldilineaceae bacterium]|nr:CPBP family intramembrane metalloprotease [Caldilineaceae bacterium]
MINQSSWKIPWRDLMISGGVLLAAIGLWRLGVLITAFSPWPVAGTRLLFGFLLSLCVSMFVWLALRWHHGRLSRQHRQPYQFSLTAIGMGLLCFSLPALIAYVVAARLGFVTLTLAVPWVDFLQAVVTVTVLVLFSEAIPEELLFRGYLYDQLARTGRLWGTLIGQALLFLVFAFAVGAVADPLDGSFLFTFALVLGLFRRVYNNVWAPIGFHLALQSAQQLLGTQWGVWQVTGDALLAYGLWGSVPITVSLWYLLYRLYVAQNSSANAVGK